jgi:hypothetical protein
MLKAVLVTEGRILPNRCSVDKKHALSTATSISSTGPQLRARSCTRQMLRRCGVCGGNLRDRALVANAHRAWIKLCILGHGLEKSSGWTGRKLDHLARVRFTVKQLVLRRVFFPRAHNGGCEAASNGIAQSFVVSRNNEPTGEFLS